MVSSLLRVLTSEHGALTKRVIWCLTGIRKLVRNVGKGSAQLGGVGYAQPEKASNRMDMATLS